MRGINDINLRKQLDTMKFELYNYHCAYVQFREQKQAVELESRYST